MASQGSWHHVRPGDQMVQSRAVDVLLRQLKPVIIHYVRGNSGSHEEGVTMANGAVVVRGLVAALQDNGPRVQVEFRRADRAGCLPGDMRSWME